jgi:hypothetical protein
MVSIATWSTVIWLWIPMFDHLVLTYDDLIGCYWTAFEPWFRCWGTNNASQSRRLPIAVVCRWSDWVVCDERWDSRVPIWFGLESLTNVFNYKILIMKNMSNLFRLFQNFKILQIWQINFKNTKSSQVIKPTKYCDNFLKSRTNTSSAKRFSNPIIFLKKHSALMYSVCCLKKIIIEHHLKVTYELINNKLQCSY